jgi:hypothetical protein
VQRRADFAVPRLRDDITPDILLLPTGKPLMLSEPSEGVFFVIRLPDSWQLCTCRHDEYGPLGLPDFWVEALGPMLNLWLAHFAEHTPNEAETRHQNLEKALGQIVSNFDAFPRGEVTRGPGRKRYTVKHGGGLQRAMHVPRREIEEAFGIRGRATWVEDDRLKVRREGARRLRELFQLDECWEDH